MIQRRKRSAGRPTAEDVSRLDQTILHAATEVFHERGFVGASMLAIAARAKTSRQTLYARFPSKKILYEALIEERTSLLLSEFASILDGHGSVEEVLSHYGQRMISSFVSSDLQRLHRRVIADASTFPKLAEAFYNCGPNRGRKLLIAYLQKQVRGGLLDIPNIEYAAEQFAGSLIGTVVVRSTLSQPSILTSEDAVRRWVATAVRTFLSAYGKR